MNAVDTNVFVYSVDANAPEKQARAIAFLESLDAVNTVTPWQVACEVGSVLLDHARRGRFSGDPAVAITALRSRFRIVTPREHALDIALGLVATSRVSYWDSLLIAACIDAGVRTLYTEDVQAMPQIAGVDIVNPFK
jgi:predicted nucleic acid-binding protein